MRDDVLAPMLDRLTPGRPLDAAGIHHAPKDFA
jgi:hypothetical protein